MVRLRARNLDLPTVGRAALQLALLFGRPACRLGSSIPTYLQI